MHDMEWSEAGERSHAVNTCTNKQVLHLQYVHKSKNAKMQKTLL